MSETLSPISVNVSADANYQYARGYERQRFVTDCDCIR